ncbi:MAG: hypothetical protein JJU33_13360 [Phycisphaerales bacterium]|nr:hypothetical protein [Phycisphaerales bacterium]
MNPWPEAFVQTGDFGRATGQAPVLELAEFEDLSPEETLQGHEVIGHASMTARYTTAIESDLRRFGAEIGADRVVWGLRLLHTELDTDLRPVFETDSATYRTRRDADGRRTEVRRRGTSTTYVPVVRERAYYAFRAVFYRRAD